MIDNKKKLIKIRAKNVRNVITISPLTHFKDIIKSLLRKGEKQRLKIVLCCVKSAMLISMPKIRDKTEK